MFHNLVLVSLLLVLVPLASCSSYSIEPGGMSAPLIPPLHPQSPFYLQILEVNNISLVTDTTKPIILDRTHYLNWLLNSKSTLNDFGEIHAFRGGIVMEMYIGNKPTQKVQGAFDTGSGIVWFLGEAMAGKTNFPYLNQSKSTTYRRVHCEDQETCFHSNHVIVPCRGPAECQFHIMYAKGTQAFGVMGTDDAYFKPDWDYITDFAFGCSLRNSDTLSGIVGMDNSNYSLVRQMEPEDPKFSYCISEDLSKMSQVEFGLQTKIGGESLDMMTNKNNGFYYIDVVSIKVNEQDIDVKPWVFEMSDDGKQGFIIGSGTTITEITKVAFDALKKKIEDVVGKPSTTYSFFGICYLSSQLPWTKPVIGIEFTNFVYKVPEQRAWEKIPGTNKVCLKIVLAPPPPAGGLSVLGSDLLLGVNVAHDPKAGLLYLQPTTCFTLD